MNDDIVTRLRKAVCWCNDFDGRCHTCEAADEIERLREKVQDLRMYAEQDACEIERVQTENTDWKDLAIRVLEANTRVLDIVDEIEQLRHEVDRAKQAADTDVQVVDVDLVARLRLEASNEGQLGNWELQALLNEAAEKITSQSRTQPGVIHRKTDIQDTITTESVDIGVVQYLEILATHDWLSDRDQDACRRGAATIKQLNQKLYSLLNLFDNYWDCPLCALNNAGYLKHCQHPLHQLHDTLYTHFETKKRD